MAGLLKTLFGFGRKKADSNASAETHGAEANAGRENTSRALFEGMRRHPEIMKVLAGSTRTLDPDEIVRSVMTSPSADSRMAAASIYLMHIGVSAIPHVTPLLGAHDARLGRFAANTLAGIPESLPEVIHLLDNDNSAVRLNAAGCLQSFGRDAVPAVGALCRLIKREAVDVGEAEQSGGTEIAGVAAGALGLSQA